MAKKPKRGGKKTVIVKKKPRKLPSRPVSIAMGTPRRVPKPSREGVRQAKPASLRRDLKAKLKKSSTYGKKPAPKKRPKPPAKKKPGKRKLTPRTTKAPVTPGAGRLPRGFKTIEPSAGGPGRVRRRKPKEAKDYIVRVMRNWQAKAEEAFKSKKGKALADTDVLHHINSDGSVSAEFRVSAIAKKQSIDNLLFGLGIIMQGAAVNGAWLSIGFRFPPNVSTEDDFTYKKFRGSDMIRSHTRRFVEGLVPYIVQQARDLHERYMRPNKVRASMVFVRVWWNPLGKRPKRRY